MNVTRRAGERYVVVSAVEQIKSYREKIKHMTRPQGG